MSFVHLQTHSEYSILDSLIKVRQLVAAAKENGFKSIALTDHGNMYGVFEFWKECHEQEIKPILGCEVYIAPKTRYDKNPAERTYAAVLLAKNLEGYKNLIKLVSLGHLEGFYYRPRVDRELLEKYSNGLIMLSGSDRSEIISHLELGDADKAKESAIFYNNIFKQNYYLQINRVGNSQENEVNQKIIAISKELNIPLITTADVHYLHESDFAAREIIWAISDGKKLSDPSRRQDKTHQYYFKKADEMVKLWGDIPEILENTIKIDNQIEDYKITYGIVQPKFNKIPITTDRGLLVEKLAYEGAEKLYGSITPQLKERLDYELEILHEKGFDEYLLVVQDYANEARSRGIVISARGSVVGSVAVYCLGITNTDPLWWNLPFERFLNKERNSFPDIDMDFQDDRRDEMFDYVRQVYGKECCSNVITFGKLTTKAAIRDVGRVMGIPLSTCDKLSKMVTVKFGRVTKAKDMMDPVNFPEFVEIVNSSNDLKLMMENVMKIEGLNRNVGMHACGFLITPEPIYNYIPVCFEKEGKQMMTQIIGSKLEDLGLMKFDFLGVTNLSAVGNALKFIKKYRNLDLDLQKIDIEDEKTFELIFRKADTNAVFQLESGGMKKYLKEMKPKTIRDIAALIALYRPGPMMNIPEYIACMNGTKQSKYLTPESKEVLEETFGVMVYQDQAMLMAIKAAGYTWGEADGLRKAMGKKIPELMAEQEKKFKSGVIAKGYSEDIANQLFEQVKPFADYGFNKAHTAAYATLSFWTAYLKANYTLEFIAALMQGDIEKPDKLTRDILEAQNHNIPVLPPDINLSELEFSIEMTKNNGQIRFGLGGMKTVGLTQIHAIIEARGNKPFHNLEDFFSRIDTKKVTKGAIEVLIKVGAFDSFANRAQLLEVYLDCYESAQKIAKSKENATLSMFSEEEVSNANIIQYSNLADVPPVQKVEWEKEYLGVFFSEHPLKRILSVLEKQNIHDLTYLQKTARVGNKVKIAAMVKKMRVVLTKKDSKKMAFGTIEDPTKTINFTVFPSIFEKLEGILEEGKTYIISGKKDFRDEQYGIIVDDIEIIDFDKFEVTDLQVQSESKLVVDEKKHIEDLLPNGEFVSQNIIIKLKLQCEEEQLVMLNNYFLNNPGNTKITLLFGNNDGNEKKMVLNNSLQITMQTEQDIKNIIPEAHIEIL